MTVAELTIEIGGMPIRVRTDSAEFLQILENRYGGFVNAAAQPVFTFDVEIVPPGSITDEEELSVRFAGGRWVLERGDFHAECDPARGQAIIRQSANPYAIDAALRIVHSLLLAQQGGLLVHAASAIRNGRAFLFAGVSGVGKTTMCRLAPPDVTLLTDEISYVRRARREESGVRSQESGVTSEESGVRSQDGSQIADRTLAITNHESPIADCPLAITNHQSLTADRTSAITNHQSPIANIKSPAPSPQPLTPAFQAFGTPFAGELGVPGENVRAPLAAVYLLAQGPENRIEEVGEAQAVRALLADVLFFAHDPELVAQVFDTTCELVARVPVRRLVFVPDARVWELIG